MRDREGKMKKKALFLLFALLVLPVRTSAQQALTNPVSSADSLYDAIRSLQPYAPYQNSASIIGLSCPRVEFKDCDKDLSCPPGWEVDENASFWEEAKIVACKPKADTTAYPIKCYYYNTACIGAEEKTVFSPDSEPYLSESVIKGDAGLPKVAEGRTRLPELLVSVMTADPEAYNMLSNARVSEKKRQNNRAFWNFVYTSFVSLLNSVRVLSYLFTLFILTWFMGSYTFNLWLFQKFEREGAFPYYSMPTYLLRAAIAAVVFFFPLPDAKVNDQYTMQPLFVKVVRGAAQMGNLFADSVSKHLSGAFIDLVVTGYQKSGIEGEYVQQVRSLQDEYNRILQLEKQIVDNCYLVYDTYTFQLPDDVLQQVHYAPRGNIEGTAWSPERCRQEEAAYLAMVANYDKNVESLRQWYSSSAAEALFSRGRKLETLKYFVGGGILGLTRSPSERWAEGYREFWGIVDSLGWLSFPTVVVPASRLMTVMTDFAVESVTTSVGSERSTLADYAPMPGKLRSKIARWLVMVALPPGSFIYHGVMSLQKKIMSKIGGVLKLSNIAAAMGVEAATTAAGFALSIMLAHLVLKMLPVFAILLAFVFRYIAYLIEVIKITFVSPFVFAWSLSFRRHVNAVNFAGKCLHILAYPLMMVISAFVALVVAIIIDMVAYTVPAAAISWLQSTNLAVGTHLLAVTSFVKYIACALLWYLSIIASTLACFIVTFQGPEWLLEAFGRWEGGWQGPVHFTRLVGERMTYRFISPI